MKKIVFTLAAMMSMTLAFAEGETSTKTNVAVAPEAAKYEMNINVESLGRTLHLDYDTERTVSYITSDFARDMHKAAIATETADRDKLYKKAVNHNLAYMRSVLDDSQYHEYVKLLNTTLNNRGLNK